MSVGTCQRLLTMWYAPSVKRAVIRLPNETLVRLDRLAEELRAAHPEESYSRASVVRALIASGLMLAERHEDRRLDVARRAARTAPRRVDHDGGAREPPQTPRRC
jgi:hypothetical protein